MSNVPISKFPNFKTTYFGRASTFLSLSAVDMSVFFYMICQTTHKYQPNSMYSAKDYMKIFMILKSFSQNDITNCTNDFQTYSVEVMS